MSKVQRILSLTYSSHGVWLQHIQRAHIRGTNGPTELLILSNLPIPRVDHLTHTKTMEQCEALTKCDAADGHHGSMV